MSGVGGGGGVALAELQLANAFGCKTAMIASHTPRLEQIALRGIEPIDRAQFHQLTYDPQKWAEDFSYKQEYLNAESIFLSCVHEKTAGDGVSIFIDNIGTPVYRATLKALAREGVITTCGWKHGMEVSYLRAVECIERHIHVHTHVVRYAEGVAAIRFAEEHEWLPQETECVLYGWEDVPQLAREYSEGSIVSYFPLVTINRL